MTTEDNTHYLRLLLLEIKGGIYVVKQVLLKELAKTGQELNTLLLGKKHVLQKRLDSQHIEKLFPINGTLPDINDWDLGLLIKVTQRIFVSSESLDISQLEQILIIRNELAHSTSAEVDIVTYRAKLSLLKRALVDLSKGISQEVESETEALIQECIDGPLDTAYMKEYDEKDNIFHALLLKLKVIQSGMSESAEKVIGEVKASEMRQLEAMKKILPEQSKEVSKAAMKEIMAEHFSDISKAEKAREQILIYIQTNGDKDDIEQVVKVKVHLAGTTIDQEKTVDDVFISSWNRENGGNTPVVNEAIAEMKNDLTRGGNAEALPAERGCVLLRVKYKSINGLKNFFEYLYSDDHQQRSIEICHTILKQTGIACVPIFMVTPETFQEIFKRYGSTKDTPRDMSVALPLRCVNMRGLLHVLNLLMDGEACEKFEKIATSLSCVMGGEVSVKVTADAQEFMLDLPKNSESSYQAACLTDVAYNFDVLSPETKESKGIRDAKEPQKSTQKVRAESSFAKNVVKETPIEIVVRSQSTAEFTLPAYIKDEEDQETDDDRM